MYEDWVDEGSDLGNKVEFSQLLSKSFIIKELRSIVVAVKQFIYRHILPI